MQKTSLQVNNSYTGESIEAKLARIIHNKQPITDGATQLIYQDRNEGINPDMDIRTDRWEHAIEAQDKISKYHMAKRKERIDALKPKTDKNDGGPEPIQGTEQTPKA